MEEAEGDQWTSHRDVWALTTPVDFHHTLLCHYSSFRIFKNRVGTWSLLEGGIITALLFAVFLTDDEKGSRLASPTPCPLCNAPPVQLCDSLCRAKKGTDNDANG